VSLTLLTGRWRKWGRRDGGGVEEEGVGARVGEVLLLIIKEGKGGRSMEELLDVASSEGFCPIWCVSLRVKEEDDHMGHLFRQDGLGHLWASVGCTTVRKREGERRDGPRLGLG
jgi:hypothetical protein